MDFRVAIWGEEKTGKTSMALTFPKPLLHFDLDIGGYERAAWRLGASDTDGIISKVYSTPVQMSKMMGLEMDTDSKGNITTRFPKRVQGYREVWQDIIVDFVKACENKDVSTIVIDSATQLWQICHRAELQAKQEIQISKNPKISENELREKLQPVEFPNEKMRQLIYTAKSYRKNLVLTHYPRPVYSSFMTSEGMKEMQTGEKEMDGFKETLRLVDIQILTELDKKSNPTARITLCGLPGLGVTAVGMPIAEPTYQGLANLAKSLGYNIE